MLAPMVGYPAAAEKDNNYIFLELSMSFHNTFDRHHKAHHYNNREQPASSCQNLHHFVLFLKQLVLFSYFDCLFQFRECMDIEFLRDIRTPCRPARAGQEWVGGLLVPPEVSVYSSTNIFRRNFVCRRSQVCHHNCNRSRQALALANISVLLE